MITHLLAAIVLFQAGDDAKPRFADVDIHKQYAIYLQAEPLLMEVAGAKVLRLQNGNSLVMGVGSTALNDETAKERLRAETVCRAKALAFIVGDKEGVQIARVEQLKEKTVVILQDGKEKAKSVSELLEITKTQVHGIAKGFAVIGRWKSADRKTYYLAIGGILDSKGNPVVERTAK